MEALLDDLSTADWVFAVKKDSNNRVQNLFFAHQKQVELLLANPDVLLMDCTYRTNKYKLPLLHILGCTNLQTFFSAGFCFLSNETHVLLGNCELPPQDRRATTTRVHQRSGRSIEDVSALAASRGSATLVCMAH